MPKMERTIPVMYNGVSQQPETLRLPSQFESEENSYPSVTIGNPKRPPFEHVAELATLGNPSNAYLHYIDRDDAERYQVTVVDGDIFVNDLSNGNSMVVQTPPAEEVADMKSYLTSSNPVEDFRLMTVGDYTFVLNTKVITRMADLTLDQVVPPAHFLPVTSFGEEDFMVGVGARRNAGANVSRFSPNYAGTLRGTVQTLQDLPETPNTGDVYKIVGDPENPFISYYVVREGGEWVETVRPGLKNLPDAATMPHALVRQSDGTFMFTRFGWNPRPAGDDETNKNPTFIDRPIRDVFFYRNRLGFLSGENVIMSTLGDYGMFYRKTVLQTLDTAPIDLSPGSTSVARLNYAVPGKAGLMVFADDVQFVVSSETSFSPNSIATDPVTNYDMSKGVRPISLGSEMYYLCPAGKYSSLREYVVADESRLGVDAIDVTKHCSRYLPSEIDKITGSANFNAIFCHSEEDPEYIYVYRYLWNGDDKIQSAWIRWKIPQGVTLRGMKVVDEYLYVSLQESSGMYLCKVNIQEDSVIDEIGYDILLDRRTQPTGIHNQTSDYKEFTIPYTPDQDSFRIIHKDGENSGKLIATEDYQWMDASTVRVLNWGGRDADEVYVGQAYEQRIGLSRIFPRDRQNDAVINGQLNIRMMTINFTDAAHFAVEVEPYGNGMLSTDISIAPSRMSDYSGMFVGEVELSNYAPKFDDGQYTFTVMADAKDAKITLKNNSHLQCKFQSLLWQGVHTTLR